MSDEIKKNHAIKVYETLCEALEKREWKYDKKEDKMVVYFGVSGDDLPMDFIITVDEDRQLIRLISPMSFKMSEEKRIDGAIATCVASYGMADGSFDYDLSDGRIVFRMTASFIDSEIGEDLFQYMISCACAMVDMYNDQFLAIDKGFMSISEFIEKK